MRQSITTRLWLSILALVLVSLGVMGWTANRLLLRFYTRQVVDPLLFHARQFARVIEADPEAAALAPTLAEMIGGGVQLWSGDGELLYATPEVFASVMPETLVGGDGATVSLPTGEAYIGAGVPAGQGGLVVLLTPAAPLQAALGSARLYLLLAVVGAAAIATALALILARQVTRPVLRMREAAQLIAQGDYAVSVPVERLDEVGELAVAVNEMAVSLSRFEAQRKEFLANVAHELRTPLSYVRGYSQALATGLVSSEAEKQQYLEIINAETVRLGALVDDLMELTELDGVKLSLAPVALADVVSAAVDRVAARAQELGVQVLVDLPALPPVQGDFDRLVQVFLNLLDNALRYAGSAPAEEPASAEAPPEAPPPFVAITGQVIDGSVTVSVRDSGPGLPADELDRVFERLYTGDRSRSGRTRGLGLAIVAAIVRGHGGQVWAENHPEGGARFSVNLPLLTDSPTR